MFEGHYGLRRGSQKVAVCAPTNFFCSVDLRHRALLTYRYDTKNVNNLSDTTLSSVINSHGTTKQNTQKSVLLYSETCG